LGRQTDESSEDLSKHSFDEFCGDLPSFIIFIMQNSNGQSLLDFISLHGTEQLADSLTLMHDWILYDSTVLIDEQKKEVLHDVQQLAQQLRQLKND